MTVSISHDSADSVATFTNNVGVVGVAYIHLDGHTTKTRLVFIKTSVFKN